MSFNQFLSQGLYGIFLLASVFFSACFCLEFKHRFMITSAGIYLLLLIDITISLQGFPFLLPCSIGMAIKIKSASL